MIKDDNKENFSESLQSIFAQTEDLFDKKLPFDEEVNFKVSDILDPFSLNNIKNDPKYCLQKFKIYFVKFFTMEDYFFKMEAYKKKNEFKVEDIKLKDNIIKKEIVPEKPEEQLICYKEEESKKGLFRKDLNKSTRNKELIEFELIKKIKNEENLQIISSSKRQKNIYTNKSYSLIHNTKDKNKLYIKYDIKIYENSKNILSLSSSSVTKIKIDSKKKSTFSTIGDISFSSFSYVQKQALIAMGYNEQNIKNINEIKVTDDYKFKLIKSNLNLDENDEMNGKAFEDYVRKIFKIMCILGTKKEVFFDNPDKIIFSKIIDFYLKNSFIFSLDIDIPIKNILYNNIKEGNELDIVYHLEYKELLNITIKFQNYFLINKLQIDDGILNIIEDNDEVTLICEIAKNIVKQGNEKLSQILNYIKIFSIMNKIAKSTLSDNEEYKEICYDYKCSPNTEKIFCIITDGEYKKLKKIIDFIKEILKESLTPEKIKTKIINFINLEKTLFSNEANLESLRENIYCTYLIFSDLQKNKIKHALLYIGDITTINYEEICNKLYKKNISNTNNGKKDIDKIKQNYVKLKQTIREFEKKLSDVTTVKSNNMDIIFKEMRNQINEIFLQRENQFMKKIMKQIKFDAFLFFVETGKGENTSNYESMKSSDTIQKLKLFFNLKFSKITLEESEHLIQNIRKCSEQYGKKIIFIIYEASFYLKKHVFYIPTILVLGFYLKEKNKVNVGFDFDFCFLDNLPIQFTVNQIIDNKMKQTKKLFDKEILLLKQNLPKKIINDFNHLFQQNKENYDFVNFINNINFSSDNKVINILKDYHKNALNLFEEINGQLDINIRKKILENVEIKLKELMENLLSFNIYTIVFKKIVEIVAEVIKNNIIVILKRCKNIANDMLDRSSK